MGCLFYRWCWWNSFYTYIWAKVVKEARDEECIFLGKVCFRYREPQRHLTYWRINQIWGKTQAPGEVLWPMKGTGMESWLCKIFKDISSSVMPFSSCLQSFSASGSFPMSQFFTSVQFSSNAQWCPTLCDPMICSMPGFPVHQQLPEFTQTHVHWFGDAIQSSPSLLSPSPPTFNLHQHQGLFKWVSSSIRWSKYWSFSFNISPSNDYSGLISFRMD